MKILIVDDSRAMQTIVRRGIEQLGYDNIQLNKADNGKEALDVIRVWEPDFVISDWHMPEMTGMELLTAVNREMLGIDIGFVTTESSEEKIKQATDAGARFVVQKPFNFKTLHEAVLPIIQGSLAGEKALDNQPPATEPTNQTSQHIDLPAPESLAKAINQISSEPVFVNATSFMTLQPTDFPYLLGLYEDSEEKVVRAVAILNLYAACSLGACLGKIDEDTIHVAIAEKALPKSVMDNCQEALSTLGAALQKNTHKHSLVLRSVNLMRQHNPSIEKLLKKESQDRLDVKIKTKHYEEGFLTFIVS